MAETVCKWKLPRCPVLTFILSAIIWNIHDNHLIMVFIIWRTMISIKPNDICTINFISVILLINVNQCIDLWNKAILFFLSWSKKYLNYQKRQKNLGKKQRLRSTSNKQGSNSNTLHCSKYNLFSFLYFTVLFFFKNKMSYSKALFSNASYRKHLV